MTTRGHARRTPLLVRIASNDAIERLTSLAEIFEKASSMPDASRGAAWKERYALRFGFIPPSVDMHDEIRFHFLCRNGKARRIGGPTGRSHHWNQSYWPYLDLFHAMHEVRSLLVGKLRAVGLAPAQAFILRPFSLLALRYQYAGGMRLGGNESHPGSLCDLYLAPQASGHDRLEEPDAIARDFPGVFKILT